MQASDAEASRGPVRAISRLRAVAVCVGLTAVAFLQAPGLAVADTKIDLTVNPIGFLTRSLHLWDPNGSFGQLQNQAYGYLWPMGPFFAAGSWLGMPAWVVQRVWWAALMCLAFLGVVKLAERLGIGTPWARLVAGVAFAMSPRVLTELGANSVEAWPMAIAPWVLVPLIGLGRGSRTRPAVTRSALVLACAGGVNATAVLAVACLGAIWLATLKPLRRRLTALGAWTLAVVCATAWWVGPLLILGRYSPQFLAYTEGAEVTTRVTDTVTVLRGASHWVAYLETTFGPAWPAGWRLATEPVLVVATIAVAVVGFVGLSRRGIPHRGFLITSLVAGAAMVGLGHVSAVDSSISGLLREFLNGVGSPLPECSQVRRPPAPAVGPRACPHRRRALPVGRSGPRRHAAWAGAGGHRRGNRHGRRHRGRQSRARWWTRAGRWFQRGAELLAGGINLA